jgi:hypothetical protein
MIIRASHSVLQAHSIMIMPVMTQYPEYRARALFPALSLSLHLGPASSVPDSDPRRWALFRVTAVSSSPLHSPRLPPSLPFFRGPAPAMLVRGSSLQVLHGRAFRSATRWL